MANRTKEHVRVDRAYQRLMESEGETWDLQIVISGGGEERVLATLSRFRKRGHLKADVRRKVIAAARTALVDAGIVPVGR